MNKKQTKNKQLNFRGRDVYPVYLSLGNLPLAMMRKRKAKQIIALLPVIHAADADVLVHHQLLHDCMRIVLNSVRAHRHTVFTCIDATMSLRQYVVRLGSCIYDYPEAAKMSGCYGGSGKVQQPCIVCHVPRTATHDVRGQLTAPAPARTEEEGKTLWQQQDEDQQNEKAKVWSMRPVKNGFWDLPNFEIHIHLPPDLMHVLEEGIIKHVVNCLLEHHLYRGAAPKSKLDARIRSCSASFPAFKGINKSICEESRFEAGQYLTIGLLLWACTHDIVQPSTYVFLVK